MTDSTQPRIVTVGSVGENGELTGWDVEGGTIDMWALSDLKVLEDIQTNMGEHDAERAAITFPPTAQ